MMKIRMVLSTTILLIAMTICAQSQNLPDIVRFNPDIEAEFVNAMNFFKAGQFDTAAVLFAHTVKRSPRSHRATGALIMGGKAYYEIKDYKESIRFLKNLIDLYPQSDYVDDAHYTLGLNYYRMSRYEDAASEFIIVMQVSNDARVLDRSGKLLENLTSSSLTLDELQLLKSDTKNGAMQSLLNIKIAEKMLSIGDVAGAVDILHKVAEMPPNIKYVSDALSLLEQIEKNSSIKIGIVLPLMVKADNPAIRELGLEFLQGIQQAVEEYNQSVPVKIVLDVRDTEKEQSVAARQVADLCSDEKICAIIGPVLSNEVFASAGIANERGVPLITPTATANGIAAIGPFVFQANPDFDTRGRNAAAFAFNTLGARSFAVLAPSDPIGKQLAESFVAEVNLLGGEIIDAQWYTAGSTDLRMELTSIRRKAMEKMEVPMINFGAKMRQAALNKIIRYGVDQHVLDSLIERELIAPVTLLFGKRGHIIADSLGIPTKMERMNYDSLGLPVNNIDAIFIPITSSEEIPIVSSQLKYFSIQAQILGTGDWNDAGALDQSRQYSDGAIFFVDSYAISDSEAYRAFDAKYRLANNNKAPVTNVLYGYDVANVVIKVISQGKSKRSDVAAVLANIEGFEGLHSKISLSRNRVNSCLTALQYKDRKILRIGEVDLTHIGK